MVNTNKYMAKFLFLHLLDFLKVLYFFPAFFLSCFLSFFLKSFIFFLMHWSSLRSLLRTYEWSTCRNPSIVFTDAKSATEKERRHLHISNNAPNLSPKILHKHYFQFLWDGYNIQEKWKTPWKVMQNWAGGGGGGGQIRWWLWEMCKWQIQLSWPNKLGQYFTSRQATQTLIYLIFSLTLPSVLCVNAKRSHGLSFFCSRPHEQLTVKATDEWNHFRFLKSVLLFKTVLKLTAAWLA